MRGRPHGRPCVRRAEGPLLVSSALTFAIILPSIGRAPGVDAHPAKRRSTAAGFPSSPSNTTAESCQLCQCNTDPALTAQDYYQPSISNSRRILLKVDFMATSRWSLGRRLPQAQENQAIVVGWVADADPSASRLPVPAVDIRRDALRPSAALERGSAQRMCALATKRQ